MDGDEITTLAEAFSLPDVTEDFIIKLIEKGADIHSTFTENQDTFLHQAVKMHFLAAAELLIKKGADINSQNLQGCTPLLTLLENGMFVELDLLDNFVSMFLYYGADVTICNSRGNTTLELALHRGNTALELALHTGRFDLVNIVENLILYTLDEYSGYKLPVDVFFGLFSFYDSTDSRFLQILDFLSHLEPDFDSMQPNGVGFYTVCLFLMKPESLQLLIHKFPQVLRQLLHLSSKKTLRMEEYFFNFGTIENFRLMLESDLCCDTIEFIRKIRIVDLIVEKNQNGIIELIYYLLTYGLQVYQEDLEIVYKRFGYCDLLKLLLHMDIKECFEEYPVQGDIMPALFYDMHMDINKFLQDPHNYSLNSLSDLLDYFALPELKKLIYRLNIERLVARAERLPNVPRLEELARNACRKFLIRKFRVKTSKEFYTIIKWLPISRVHKNIITLETKLYS